MKLITTIIFLIQFSLSYSQKNENYFTYHKLINNAENHFLTEKIKDSSLYYYDKCFSEFDFIFVKDAVNAAQIAFYLKKDYKRYLIKGFENGLKLNHLLRIRLFEDEYAKISKDALLKKEYESKRKKYLSRIDTTYLDVLYKYGIQDQLDKGTDDWRDYETKKRRAFLKIEKLIRESGFPGEKLLGIADSTVFKNSNSKLLDLNQRINKYSNLKKYFRSDDEILSQQMIYLILIHNFCSYNTLNDIWLKEIKKGNIHPRDVAVFHDNLYRSNCNNPEIPYKNNLFVNYDKYSNMNKKINQKREDLYINSIELDQLKKDYEEKYGFKFFWGFWSCR